MELLDIHRILNVNRIDREKHPFAKKDCCFLIKTAEDSFIFEASSPKEKDRITQSLKLVISRLASMLIVSDVHRMDDFFVSARSGPGKEPTWFEDHVL